MSGDMKTAYEGAEGMLPQMKGNLTIRNENSTYSLVNSFSLLSSVGQDMSLFSQYLLYPLSQVLWGRWDI